MIKFYDFLLLSCSLNFYTIGIIALKFGYSDKWKCWIIIIFSLIILLSLIDKKEIKNDNTNIHS